MRTLPAADLMVNLVEFLFCGRQCLIRCSEGGPKILHWL